MNKQAKKYYRKIHHLFPIIEKEEKYYLSYLQQHLEEYEHYHQDYQYEDYIQYYGQPEDVVSSYYEHIESEYIIKHMKSRKIIKQTSLILVILAILVSTYFMILLYKGYKEFQDSQIYYEETIITNYGDIPE